MRLWGGGAIPSDVQVPAWSQVGEQRFGVNPRLAGANRFGGGPPRPRQKELADRPAVRDKGAVVGAREHDAHARGRALERAAQRKTRALRV